MFPDVIVIGVTVGFTQFTGHPGMLFRFCTVAFVPLSPSLPFVPFSPSAPAGPCGPGMPFSFIIMFLAMTAEPTAPMPPPRSAHRSAIVKSFMLSVRGFSSSVVSGRRDPGVITNTHSFLMKT